jgi:flavin reductase (DIM6/NTAB) family NADH-FMN oxidoreductase RutF
MDGTPMFYDAIANTHGLRYDPMKALVAPRPVGWISSLGSDGSRNLAPYSFFNVVSDKPNYVMFSSAGYKNSVQHISETGEFVCSLATWELRHAMNATSAEVARGVDEFALAGLTPEPSRLVEPPRVKESPVALECRHWKTVELPRHSDKGQQFYVVFGLVVGVHIDDAYIADGRIDTGRMQPIARLGYMDYSVVRPDTVFTIDRPTIDADGRAVMPKTE